MPLHNTGKQIFQKNIFPVYARSPQGGRHRPDSLEPPLSPFPRLCAKPHIHKIPLHDRQPVIGTEGPHFLGIRTYMPGKGTENHFLFLHTGNPGFRFFHIPVKQGHFVRSQHCRPETECRDILIFIINRLKLQAERIDYGNHIVLLPHPF